MPVNFVARFFMSALMCIGAGLCMLSLGAHAQQTPNPLIPTAAESAVNPLFNSGTKVGNPQAKYYQACTIFIYFRTFAGVDVVNLSTFKVSSCPAGEFQKITAASVKAQLNTFSSVRLVSMIGPHYQMMDENLSVVTNPFLPIGNLNFSEISLSHIGVRDFFTKFASFQDWLDVRAVYNPIGTKQNINFTWYQGSKLYTIVTDKGKTFAMIYYSPAVVLPDPNKTIGMLDTMGKVLNLPAGWKYEVVTLDRVLRVSQLEVRGFADELMIDELDNIYLQISTPSLMQSVKK